MLSTTSPVSNPGMHPIPDQLRRDDLRFIRIPPRSKGGKGNDIGWNSTAWYHWDSEQLEFHLLEEGFNYGVYPGPDSNVVIVDIDEPQVIESLGLVKVLDGTFTVLTGSATTEKPKCHYYFQTPDLMTGKTPLWYKDVHVGELYAQDPEKGRGYVVGPGSIHPDTKRRYSILRNLPIATRDLSDFLSHFKQAEGKPAPLRPKRDRITESLTDRLGLRIEDVCHPVNSHTVGDEIIGGHPLHGSQTGTNIHLNRMKNTWHCHRCGSGGDPAMWLAVESGILSCEDARAGALANKDTMKRLVEWMRGNGYDIPKTSEHQQHPRVEYLSEADLPEINSLLHIKLDSRLEDDNFISEYMSYWGSRTDAYSEFFHMGALSLLSIAADRRIVIPLSFGDIYTNTWTFGVGLSSVARKSTALGKCKMLAEVSFPMSKSLPGSFSTEGFIEKLSETPRSYQIKDECAQILQAINKKQYLADLRDVLAEIFECTTIHRTLRTSQRKTKTDFLVSDPYITFAWATTPDNFEQSVSVLDITSGYLVRFLYYYPRYQKRTRPVEMATGLMSEGMTALSFRYESIIRAIERFDRLRFVISDIAFDAFNVWYIAKQENLIGKPTIENTIFSRIATYVFKLAALYYVGSREFIPASGDAYRTANSTGKPHLPGDESRIITGEMLIPDRYFFAALMDIREYFLPVAVDLLEEIDSSKSENVQKLIIKFLKTEGGRVTRSQLLKKLKIKSKDFQEHLDTLVESETIEVTAVKKNKNGKATEYVMLLQEAD